MAKKTGQNRRKSKDEGRFSVKHIRYEMRLNASLDIMFARLLFQDGTGNCKKAYFLWDGRGDKIRRSVMLNEYKDCGLKMLDIRSFNYALKSKWAKKYLDDNN